MIEIVIPLTQILNMIPKEIMVSLFFIIIGSLFIFIFRGCVQLVILGGMCICMGILFLCYYMLVFTVIPAMPPIPPQWTNVTFPISVKVV